MNKLITILSFITLVSCTLSSEPDFVKIADYRILNINREEVKLGANSYFLNPNDVGCEVVKTEIEVMVNGLSVSQVNQSKIIELGAGEEFTIPLIVSIPTSAIVKDKEGILGGILSGLMNQNIAIQYEGVVTLRKAGIEFDIDIEGEEVLKEFRKL